MVGAGGRRHEVPAPRALAMRQHSTHVAAAARRVDHGSDRRGRRRDGRRRRLVGELFTGPARASPGHGVARRRCGTVGVVTGAGRGRVVPHATGLGALGHLDALLQRFPAERLHPLTDRASYRAADAVRAHLGDRVADYAIPERFLVLDELPRNAAGKVDRSRVRELVHRA